MKKNPDGQVELVLENRQLLATFFVIVILCGVFFSLGYIVGRNTFSSVAKTAQAAAASPETASKPSPMPPPAVANPSNEGAPSAEQTSGEQAGAQPDLNFYQSVEEKTPEAKLVPPEPAGTTVASTAGPRPAASEKPVVAPPVPSQPAPATASAQPSPANTGPPPAGIFVQVSALTRREDANTLVALLKEKRLPVMVTAGVTDTLFHVVIGPYNNLKDAEHVKSLLEQDGFRPIIKR